MLIACVLLNRTTGTQVIPVFRKIILRWPTPRGLSRANTDLEEILRPLGLWRRRSELLRKLGSAYASGKWSTPLDLPGIGQYAMDSWTIFVEGEKPKKVSDGKLRSYLDRLRRGDRGCHGEYRNFVNKHRRNRCLSTYIETYS